jgi:hypothetical protein
MQALIAAGLTMGVSIATDRIEAISIGQAYGPQCLELVRLRLQFECGRNYLFHMDSIVQMPCESQAEAPPPLPQTRKALLGMNCAPTGYWLLFVQSAMAVMSVVVAFLMPLLKKLKRSWTRTQA